MSGIYIKGMEMPKSCPCELIGIGYDLCCSFAGGIPARVKEYYECCQNDTRPSWCPLIPVPDHGRLIDADALAKEIEYARFHHSHTDGLAARHHVAEYGHFLKALSEFPTIIPADKEGE